MEPLVKMDLPVTRVFAVAVGPEYTVILVSKAHVSRSSKDASLHSRPRGRDPFGQHQESIPLAAPNTGGPRFTDSLSNLANLIG